MEGSVRSPGSGEVVEEQLPLAYGAALRALTGCFASTARLLWRVLALVSVRGSIHYVVLPGLRRDELLEQPQVGEADAAAWWRLAGVT